MKIIARAGNEEIANVYLAKTNSGKYIEFVESVQPPLPREKKWVLIISTLSGCPISCAFCDCGKFYNGKLSKEEILEQIDYLVSSRFSDNYIPIEKFKIQFARVGEPSLNLNVLKALEELKNRYITPGILPSISTVAPFGRDVFFQNLLDIKKRLYKTNFQLQFSIHSTDYVQRDEIIPIKKWDFNKIADYSASFFDDGGRKITLNFALSEESIFDIKTLKRYFNPDIFLIKITPINPTYSSKHNKIKSLITPEQSRVELINKLKNEGFDVILSIGEWEENKIGSNCGQYIQSHLNASNKISNGYTYDINMNKKIDKSLESIKHLSI